MKRSIFSGRRLRPLVSSALRWWVTPVGSDRSLGCETRRVRAARPKTLVALLLPLTCAYFLQVPGAYGNTYFFGTDTNSHLSAEPGTSSSYYEGQIGGVGRCNSISGSNWTYNDSLAVPQGARFGYWDIAGPGQAGPNGPTALDAFGYGYQEGQNAYNCQVNWAFSQYDGQSVLSGLTVFADIESGNGNWYLPSGSYGNLQVTLNDYTLLGFLEAIGKDTHVSPGLYISESFMNGFMPSLSFPNPSDPNYPYGDPYVLPAWYAAGPGGCAYASSPGTLQSASYYEGQFLNFYTASRNGQCTAKNIYMQEFQACTACSGYGGFNDIDVTAQSMAAQHNQYGQSFWDVGAA